MIIGWSEVGAILSNLLLLLMYVSKNFALYLLTPKGAEQNYRATEYELHDLAINYRTSSKM